MSQTYQLKVTAGKAEAKLIESAPGTGKTPAAIKAEPGARYQITQTQTGLAPDNIRISRQGKHLKIFVDSVAEPSFVIEEFYDQTGTTVPQLIGKSEDGGVYEYTPENAASSSLASQLQDNGQIHGMALGGPALQATGAAVGAVFPVVNPWLAAAAVAAGAGAAAGGGGGGGGGNSPANPNSQATLTITSVDDGKNDTTVTTGSKDTGLSASDFYTADNTLTYFGKASNFTANGDQIKIELKDATGKLLTSAYVTPDASGNWSWSDSANARADGNYTLSATIVDKAGNTVSASANQTLTIDTSEQNNTDPSKPDNTPSLDPNAQVKPTIVSIDDGKNDTTVATGSKDTGLSPSDFYTADNTLTYFGKASNFTANGDQIKIELKDATGKLLASAYVIPDTSGNWNWSDSANARADGNYTLNATIVDKAGNAVSASTSQTVTIDTSGQNNTDPSKPDNAPSADPNANLSLNISGLVLSNTGEKTGLVDFYNKAPQASMLKGTLSNAWTSNTDFMLLEVFNRDGTRLSNKLATVAGSSWSSDNTLLNQLSDGAYVLRASIMDRAGNVMAIDTQRFVIDTQLTSPGEVEISSKGSSITIKAPESGQLFVNGVEYYPSASSNQKLNSERIKYNFTDYAGNSKAADILNTTFNGEVLVEGTGSQQEAVMAVSTAGDIGTYTLTTPVSTLDLSKVIADKGTSVFNGVDLSGQGANTLNITLKDLLVIGLSDGFILGSNTFSKDKSYATDIQFKVRGDTIDKVNLLGFSDTKSDVMLGNTQYHVYHATHGNLDVDIFVQQGMSVTL